MCIYLGGAEAENSDKIEEVNILEWLKKFYTELKKIV